MISGGVEQIEGCLDLGILPAGVPSSVLVTEVRSRRVDVSEPGWSPGPLPILQATNATTVERGNLKTTDADARRTLVASQQADILYGGAGPRRWHRITAPSADEGILAVELLLGPATASQPREPATGLIAVHVAATGVAEAGSSSFDRHAELIATAVHGGDLDVGLWREVQAALPRDIRLNAGSRVRTLGYGSIDRVAEEAVRETALTAAFLMVTASPVRSFPDMTQRAQQHALTIERVDWSALVLRDGAAFVSHQTSEEPFADVLRTLVHSVHLDAMFLALLQRRLLDESGARAVTASLDTPDELVNLERRHFDFKRTYWRTSLTDKRTAPSDQVLRTFQEELLTTLDVADVEERVRDGARLARSLHAERQDRAQQELTRIVQNASVVIGALGVSFTAAPVIREPSWALFWAATGAGVVAMVIAFGFLAASGRRVGRTGGGSDGQVKT